MMRVLPVVFVWATATVPVLCQAIQANVDEVRLDIIARDSKGRVVRDLQAEDLRVFDEGVPVRLTSLRLNDANQSKETRLVTLLFAALPSDGARLAREAATEMVRAAGDDVDFAVFVLTPRMRLVEKFTHDRRALLRALDAATHTGATKTSIGYDAPENALRTLASQTSQDQAPAVGERVGEATDTTGQIARDMVRALGTAEEYAISQNATPAYAALLALVQQLGGGVLGRKTLVYFSDAPPDDLRSRSFLERVASAANRGAVSVYTFDVSGIGIWARSQSERILTAADAQTVPLASSDERSRTVQLRTGNLDALDTQERSLLSGPGPSGLRDLANNTGGFFVENSNDLRKDARRLIEDVSAYYDANFVPAQHADRQEARAIAVRPVRKGIRIQARTLYVLRRSARSGIEEFEAPLYAALSAAKPESELEVHAGVFRLASGPQGQIGASLAVEVPLRVMATQDDPEAKLFSAHFGVLAVVRDKGGTILQKFSRDIPYRGAIDQESSSKQDTYTLTGQFSAPPGEYLVEAAVLDRNSGKTGVWRGQVNIEPLSAGLWISDLSLVRRFEPLAANEESSEPFRYRNARIVPDLTREYDGQSEESLRVFFTLGRSIQGPKAPKVYMEMSRDGRMIARAELTASEESSTNRFPYLASISSKSLLSGHHEVTVIVEDNGETVTRSASFVVVGRPAAAEATALTEPSGNASAPSVPETGPEPRVVEKATAAVTSLGPDALEQQRILDRTRQRVLAFASSLPNFSCVESTSRDVSPDGMQWRKRDSFVELLEFVDGDERRTTLEVDGHKSQRLRSETAGAASQGEYGAILRSIFGPEAAASFQWQQWSTLNGRTLAVFSYRIEISHSTYALRVGARTANVGAHGLVYIDPATTTVHRVSMVADGIPIRFPYRESSISVDYEFATIGDRDYALPFAAEVQIRKDNGSYQRNQLTFRNYKRFGAKSSVKFVEK
jgi:VWFA-related protein